MITVLFAYFSQGAAGYMRYFAVVVLNASHHPPPPSTGADWNDCSLLGERSRRMWVKEPCLGQKNAGRDDLLSKIMGTL